MTRPLRIYLIAGEPSGDRLGAGLIRALRAEAPGVELKGIGGMMMAVEGVPSLFDTTELSIMGVVEVLPRLRTILRHIRDAADDVVAAAPDALVTIDSPGFGLRVAQKVRARAPGIRTIQYVPPSVWAWRPGRARHMARYVDHVLALLPFEVPPMLAVGMTCDLVGHPIATREAPTAAAVEAFRARAGVAPGQPLLLLAPGSRRGEIRRIMPVFAEVLARVHRSHPELRVAVPVAESVAPEVAAALAGAEPKPVMVGPEEGEPAKLAAFAAADVALVTSGTITLEMAAAGTPMISAYRTSWLTGEIVKRLVLVDTANLANLACGERVVPEFLQERCTAGLITPALERLIADPAARARQLGAFDRAMAAIGRGGEPPSMRAAKSVLRAIGR